MNAGRAVLEMLKIYGVDHVFGLPGETTLGLYREWKDFSGVSYHMARDERSTVFMADAYAKASGKVGVCEGPSVGATHMVPGITEAYYACVPIICITSDVPLAYTTKNMLTSCDQTAIFGGITKDTYTVNSPAEIPHIFRRAFRCASSGRPGPVHIRIPSDVLEGELSDTLVFGQKRYGSFPGIRGCAAQEDVQAACAAIAAAERPVLICGQGAMHSGAWDEVLRMAESHSIPVGTTINAKGIMPELHSMSLGVTGARGGRRWANDMIQDSDLIIYAGSSTDSAGTNGWKLPASNTDKPIVQIDADERQLGNNYDVLPLYGDVRETLRALLDTMPKQYPDRSGWSARVTSGRSQCDADVEKIISESKGLHPFAAARCLERIAPPDTFFAVDPGVSAVYSAGYMRIAHAGRRCAYNFAMGALGYAIPAAIGASFAAPGHVIALVGDGSFGFCAGELETAARLGVRVVFVVFNNQTFGWIRGTEAVHTQSPVPNSFDRFTDFAGVDYVKLAQAFGVEGYRAESAPQFEEVMKRALEIPGPVLVDLPVAPEDRELPPVPGWKLPGQPNLY